MGYTVTPLRMGESRDALARLWAENMSDARVASVVAARMRWLYEDAPEGPATTVTCRTDAGEVVGCGSFFPRATWVDGRRLRGAVLCDFAVARAHRVGGAALAIQRALVERARAEGIELLYGHPNERSVAVFKRIGYRVVGDAIAWVKPLRSGEVLRETLPWKAVAAVAAAPVDAVLRAFDGARSAGTALRVRSGPLPRSDARADALWERARRQYAVVGEQSSTYLAWRYGRFTTAECRCFAVFPPEEGRLLAFAVYTREGSKAILADLFADHLQSTAEPLLLRLSAHLRAEGAESLSVSYVGAPALGALLESVGFLPRVWRRPLVVHPEVGAPVPARVWDPASWFMLEGELDI